MPSVYATAWFPSTTGAEASGEGTPELGLIELGRDVLADGVEVHRRPAYAVERAQDDRHADDPDHPEGAEGHSGSAEDGTGRHQCETDDGRHEADQPEAERRLGAVSIGVA